MNQTDQTTSAEAEQDVTNPAIAALISAQNNAFRRSVAAGAGGAIPGKLVMTAGIAARSDAFRAALFTALVAFDTFDADCDPYGLHEMGVLEIAGERVWFKFDLYDENYAYGSEVPADPARTRRVLTLLFPSEY